MIYFLRKRFFPWLADRFSRKEAGLRRSLEEKHAMVDCLKRQAHTVPASELEALACAIAKIQKEWHL